MSKRNSLSNSPEATEYVYTRDFDAPLDLVWKVHTEVDHMKHWWDLRVLKCFRPN